MPVCPMWKTAMAGVMIAACSAASALDLHDAFWSSSAAARALPALPQGRLPHQLDTVLGRPTVLWAASDAPAPDRIAADARQNRIAQARAHLLANATALRLTATAVADAEAVEASRLADGVQIVRFEQRFAGLPVFNRRLNVLMKGDGRLVAISGYFADVPGTVVEARLDAPALVARAVEALGGRLEPSQLRVEGQRGGFEHLVALERPTGWQFNRAPRVRRLWYPMPEGLVPALYLELIGAPDDGHREDAYGFVLSATDGALLFRLPLVAHQTAEPYQYRVWADALGEVTPFDSPLGNDYQPFPGRAPATLPRVSATQNLVSLVHGPISTGDPWLPPGATTTSGNNTDAFLDTGTPDGYLQPLPLVEPVLPQDFRTQTTAPGSFDYEITADADPRGDTARHAAVVHLFYINNWLHDWFYDAGLTEEAGNAQNDNYGRGGVDGDAIEAQGQDNSGRNNANMLTPADGASPRMQMYLFDGAVVGEVTVAQPADFGAPLAFNVASFGPDVFDVTAGVVLAADSVGEPTDGCGPGIDEQLGLPVALPNPAPPQLSMAGQIALIDRGSCSFTSKVAFAQLSGAVGMVVVNNGDGDPTAMGNADLPVPLPIPEISTDAVYQVPSVMIRRDDGQRIKDLLAAGAPVQMRLQREETLAYDGTLDTQVIAHEFFHYVSNRLVGNASGLSNSQGRSMGEGWSDFASTLLTIREEDRQVAGNRRYEGIYVTGYYVTDSAYFGIRRAPYSTDFSINPLTFRHVEAGVPLPDSAPIAFGQDGANNAAVHSSGEIWSNALVSCYANLLNDPQKRFAEAQARMKTYLINGLKMTPNAPTFTEARDGVLAAALASSERDFALCSQGFAARGWGLNAVSPPRDSTDHVGVVEDYTLFAPAINLDAAPAGDRSCGLEGAAAGADCGVQGGGSLPPTLLLSLLGFWALRRRRA
jgi:hypothetical protein